MKNLPLLLLAALLMAGIAMPVLAAQTIGGTTPAVVAPVSGLGARAQAATVTPENQQAPLKTPPVLKHHRRGDGTAVQGLGAQSQKHWVARDFKLQPSATAKTGLKSGTLSPPAHTPAPSDTPLPGMRTLDSSYLNLQDQEQDKSKQDDTLSKSSSKRHDTVKNSISNVR